MTDQPAPSQSSSGPVGDYGYDEAHDVAAAQMTGRNAAAHPVEAPPVASQADGDYGYDEAHDFRAR